MSAEVPGSSREDILFAQCRAMISNAEESLQRIENHALKITADFERRIAELESKVENLAQQVRARDAI